MVPVDAGVDLADLVVLAVAAVDPAVPVDAGVVPESVTRPRTCMRT